MVKTLYLKIPSKLKVSQLLNGLNGDVLTHCFDSEFKSELIFRPRRRSSETNFGLCFPSVDGRVLEEVG